MERFVVVAADLSYQGAVDSLVNVFLLFESVCDFLGESKAKIEDRFTLQNLLRLVELFPHELIEVIVEDEVLELSELLGHELLLDLVHDVVGFVVFEVALHEHLLSQLARCNKNILVMVESVRQELLVTESHQVSLLMVNVILVLVFQQNYLVVFS